MKTKLFFSCFFILFVFTEGYSQRVNGRTLEVPVVNSREVLTVDMYDKDCVHVVDGLVSPYNEIVPQQQLAHFEQAASREKLEELGFSNSQCVMIKSSADLDVENYIYRQVDAQVRQIGIQYKIPIVVNEKLIASYAGRHRQLSNIKAEEIKKIKFLDKAEAQAKYGGKVVFGLIEITV
ncbi:hypothetical protein I2I11_09575 [Pontibacter sp. 172403-2]|uniref:hypothetical protein n=1 Tax=Pontibacter rufus TaxID=2791028 RepID=UPI0018AF69B2|nr:hypothetical protein [Pontibacter sp. 172403-2]MBF9253541.1 hypothetical protein [Pontibacter sp. 172403-2]